MLRSLRIENFKAFGLAQDIPLAPITLIYGPNSAGKSSIIQSLLLMHQSTQASAQASKRLIFSGEVIDLGTFLSAVHKHDDNLSIRLGYSFSPDRRYERMRSGISLGSMRSVDITISPSVGSKRSSSSEAHISKIRYGFDQDVGAFTFKSASEDSDNDSEANVLFELADAQSIENFAKIVQANNKVRNSPRGSTKNGKPHSSGEKISKSTIEFLGKIKFSSVNMIPSRTIISPEHFKEVSKNPISAEIAPYIFGSETPSDQIRRELIYELQSISYLGPLRSHPARHYIASGIDRATVGTRGERTPQILYRRRSDLIPRISEWFSTFGIPYSIDIEKAGNPITGEILSIILEDKSKLKVSTSDVGFGIGQLLPILVEGLVSSNRIICVEQPEIHLHPQLQAHIADFLISTAKSQATAPRPGVAAKEFGGNQWIVETHSEALMLRMMRRIGKDKSIPKDFISVLYVEPISNGKSRVISLRLDEDGDFIDDWPDGFFEERYKEIFGAR